MMDRFVEEKFVALLQHYGIPEDAPGAGWHSAAAGWRLAGALALDFFPWIGRTDDAPPKPVGRQRKTADEKLVMAGMRRGQSAGRPIHKLLPLWRGCPNTRGVRCGRAASAG